MATMPPHLPVEVHEQIVSHAIRILVAERAAAASAGRRLSEIVSVSTCWQDIIERETYRSLRITSTNTEELNQFVSPRRRRLVKVIDFSTVLPEYDPTVDAPETAHEQHKNNVQFTQSMNDLLLALASWNTSGDHSDSEPWLTLKMRMHSPSDPGCDAPDLASFERRRRSWRYAESHLRLLPEYLHSGTSVTVVRKLGIQSAVSERHVAMASVARIAEKLSRLQTLDVIIKDHFAKSQDRVRARYGKQILGQ